MKEKEIMKEEWKREERRRGSQFEQRRDEELGGREEGREEGRKRKRERERERKQTNLAIHTLFSLSNPRIKRRDFKMDQFLFLRTRRDAKKDKGK